MRIKLLVITAAIVFVFVPSRLYVLNFVKPAGTDTELYARYAYIHRLASESRASFHELYRTRGLDAFASGGAKSFDSLALTVVAYPPFAVAVMTMPALMAPEGLPVSRMTLSDFTARYKKVYRWFCAAAEMLMVAIAGLLVLVLYKNESPPVTAFRMAVLCLAGLFMPRILYDRLDVILSALLMLSLAFLVKKRVLLSFFVFALAVNFKLVPVFLLPVWILGSFTASDFELLARRERVLFMVRKGLTGGLLLCGMTAGVALFFYFTEDKGVFDFLRFHLARGVHIESVWGTFSLLAARLLGTPFQVTLIYGAYNVATPVTPVLSMLAFPLLASFLTAATVVFAARFVRADSGRAYMVSSQMVIELSLLFLCIVFTFSKIFSPQYLLALIPLVALLPYTGRGTFVFTCVFIGVCCLSTIIYPHCYTRAIVHGPTWFGLYLLTARILLLAGMTGFLFFRQFGRRVLI